MPERMTVRGRRASVFSPAKVNLYLRILDRRPDGYHNLESLVALLDWGDMVTVELGGASEGEVSIICPGYPELETQTNLASRAVRFFREHHPFREGVSIRIDKEIPPGSGLGGGSSNAVATLRALSALLDVPLDSLATHHEIARKLGADVPLFVTYSHKIVTGIGDVVSDVAIARTLFMLLITPDFSTDTTQMYQRLDESRSARAANEINLTSLFRSVINITDKYWDIPRLIEYCRNDFHQFIEAEYPVVRNLKDILSETTALATSVSGSGSAVFALFPNRSEAESAMTRVHRMAGIRKAYVVELLQS